MSGAGPGIVTLAWVLCARRSTVACIDRTRSAELSRASKRANGSSAATDSAIGSGSALSAFTRASTGMTGPRRVSMHWVSARMSRGLGAASGSREQQRRRLDFGDGRRRIGEAGLDDRKGAGLAERIEQIGRRSLGDHDHRTQERHRIRRLQEADP